MASLRGKYTFPSTITAAGKIETLEAIIGNYHRAVIAFSGGVDSTFLAWVTREIIGCNNILLVTAHSPIHPSLELKEACRIAQMLGLAYRTILTQEMNNPQFQTNPINRCYHCKKELYTKIRYLAEAEGYEVVFDGSNASDLLDQRPGRIVVEELGIICPLEKSGWTKQDIRDASSVVGLSTASKPSGACLATRFPYGEAITLPKLARVENAEARMRALGFVQFRIRSHADLARLEIAAEEMDRAWNLRKEIENICRSEGFVYAAIDITGYRSGSMNESVQNK